MTQRPSVVLFHSSASSSRQWERLVQLLQPRYAVHAVDLYGHGACAAWQAEQPLTLRDDAALAVPLLRKVGGAHIVGHSYGGAIAMALATWRPDLVRSVVAYEPVLFRWVMDDINYRRLAQDVISVADSMRADVAAGGPDRAAKKFVELWSGTGAWQGLPVSKRASIAKRIGAVLQQFDALFREPPQPGQLARLGMPMMFMSGAQTIAVTRCISALLRVAVPGARHEVLPGLGHMGPITHEAQVNERLIAFIDAHAENGRSALSQPPLPSGSLRHDAPHALQLG